MATLRQKLIEAEKALLIAKVNFNDASKALTFGIDVGMSPMQMARVEYNKAVKDVKQLKANRLKLNGKIHVAKEKAQEYTQQVLKTMNDLTGGVDVLKDGSEGEFSKLVTVFKMSHGKLIEAETNAIESKKLDLLDKEGKELDVDLGKLRLKLKVSEANKVVVMAKLRSAKRKVVAARSVVKRKRRWRKLGLMLGLMLNLLWRPRRQR